MKLSEVLEQSFSTVSYQTEALCCACPTWAAE